jgi:hypothetical protein
LDILLEATRTAFENTNLARMLGQSDQPQPQLTNTQALLANLPRLRASLMFAQTIFRFLIAGVLLFLISSRIDSTYLFWWGLVSILIAGIILFFIEWAVSRMVMQPKPGPIADGFARQSAAINASRLFVLTSRTAQSRRMER